MTVCSCAQRNGQQQRTGFLSLLQKPVIKCNQKEMNLFPCSLNPDPQPLPTSQVHSSCIHLRSTSFISVLKAPDCRKEHFHLNPL